jgi:ribosomal-protein-alanine N-acetyltransferase
MKPTLRSPRFTLTPSSESDLDRLCDLLWHPQVRRFLCHDNLVPREVVSEMLARSAELDVGGIGLWTIEAEPDGFVGVCGLLPVADGPTIHPAVGGDSDIEPLIALHPCARGRGLAKETIDALVDHARNNCGLTRLIASVDEPNEGSHRLMLRCRFSEVGRGPGPKHKLVFYERLLSEQSGWCTR